jgi:cytochrome P450
MTHDLFSYLLDHQCTDANAVDTNNPSLVYESELAIVAGSDSTASALGAILSLLGTHPDKLAILRKEIDDMKADERPLHPLALANKPYLNGCINEALRLYAAVMSGSQRETGPGWALLGGRFIPDNMLVSMPTYTLHRGEQ